MINWAPEHSMPPAGDEDDTAAETADVVRYVEEKYANGPQFVAEAGPPVERELIRRCLLDELSPDASIGVTTRVLTFRPWFEAWKEILDEIRGNGGPDTTVKP